MVMRRAKNAKICLPLGITTKSDFVFAQPRPGTDICSNAGDGTAVHLSAPGAVRHDVAHQVAHVVLQISDDVLDDVSNRDHAHDLARVQHW